MVFLLLCRAILLQVCLLDSKTGLNVSVFLKQFKGDGKDVIGWIQTFDVQNVTVEQMTALEKLLPDTNTVKLDHNVIIIEICPTIFRLIFLHHIVEIRNLGMPRCSYCS